MLTKWMYTGPDVHRASFTGETTVQSLVSIGQSSVKVLNVTVEFIVKVSNKNIALE